VRGAFSREGLDIAALLDEGSAAAQDVSSVYPEASAPQHLLEQAGGTESRSEEQSRSEGVGVYLCGIGPSRVVVPAVSKRLLMLRFKQGKVSRHGLLRGLIEESRVETEAP
jgi:hypothetical protein